MTKANSFDEAFKLLDQAINEQTLPSLGSLVSQELKEFRGEASDSLQPLIASATDILGDIDREIRAQPLLFIGAAAGLALAAGFLLATPPRQKPEALK